jgi:hypothetical protein
MLGSLIPDDGGSTHLWNVGRQSFYMVVYPRRQFWTGTGLLAEWKRCTTDHKMVAVHRSPCTPTSLILILIALLDLWVYSQRVSCSSSPRWYIWVWKHDGMIMTEESWWTQRKTCPIAIMCTINPTRTDCGTNLGSHSMRPVMGHALAQVVSRRPLTAEALVHARVNPYKICGGQSGTGTGFSPSSSVFPSIYHSTITLQTYIIWGMHNMLT